MERTGRVGRPTDMNTRTRRLLALAAVTATVLAGCGSQKAADDGGSDGIDDGTYVATTATVDGADHPLVPGSQIVLTVDGGRISLNSGCNQMSGDATWSDGSLRLDALAMTEMGCAEPLMAQDSWLATVFTGTLAVDGDAGGFTLTKGGTELSFDPQEPVADAPLAGTPWTLTSMGTGGADGAVSSVPQGVISTFEITGDKISLSPGCNSVGGKVVVTDTTLTASRMISTMMACVDARGEVEKEIMDIFSGPLDYAIDGEQVTLTAADGRFLVYQVDHGTDPEPTSSALQGTTWQLEQTMQSDDSSATGTSFSDTKATLRFEGEKVLVNTGCNVGNGSVTISGDTITVGPLMLTKKACRASEGRVEGAVLGVLEGGPVTWTLKGDRLWLTSADGASELLYRARAT